MAIKKDENQVMILVLIQALRGAIKTGHDKVDAFIWRFITGLFVLTVFYFVIEWFGWVASWVLYDISMLVALAMDAASPVIGWLGDGWHWVSTLFQSSSDPVVTVPVDPGVITEVIPPID